MSAQRDLHKHLEQFKEQGFTILEEVYDAEKIKALAAKFHHLRAEELGIPSGKTNYLISNTIERIPRLFLPVVANPLILDLAETILGPFVQISDSVMFGFDSIPSADASGKVNGWHRDRYAQMPSGCYQRPLAIGALCYMQDMITSEYGQFRVIPGSHRRPLALEADERSVPHPEEMLVPVKAGDVIVFHHALLHSGSPNTSGNTRIFFGASYNSTWMRHKDNHSGPSVQRIISQARDRNDHRMLRLFGVDDQLEARVNGGATILDELRWAEWAAADRAAIKQ